MIDAARLGGIGDEAATGIDEQIAIHQSLGWGHLELRTVDEVPIADLDEQGRRRLVDRVVHSGLNVVCLASRIGGWARPVSTPLEHDLAELSTLATLADALGTRYVRIMSYPNDGYSDAGWAAEVTRRIRVLVAEAERRGIVLLHENCSGWAGRSGERAAALVDAVDGSEHLRFLFDIGNPVAHGYDGETYLRAVLPRVAHVHVKDAVPAEGDGTEFVLPGEGKAEVARCLELILGSGYQGVLSIEPHVSVLPHLGRRAEPEVVRERYLHYARAFEDFLAGPAGGPA
jgi:sugar phosphate isomerase/epimerase